MFVFPLYMAIFKGEVKHAFVFSCWPYFLAYGPVTFFFFLFGLMAQIGEWHLNLCHFSSYFVLNLFT